KTCGATRTVKPCGPDPPTLGSSLQMTNPQATGANKPGTPGRARSKPPNIAQGVPECFGKPVVTMLVWISVFSPHGAAGAASARHSLRPHFLRGTPTMHHPDAKSRRGNAETRLSSLRVKLRRVGKATACAVVPTSEGGSVPTILGVLAKVGTA